MWKLKRDIAAGNCNEDLRASSRKEDQRATEFCFCLMAGRGSVDAIVILTGSGETT
jgi:hypothetical protein